MVMQPVGPLPASTYWRRRLVLLLVLLVVLLLLKSCVGGRGRAHPTAAGSTPSPTATSRPSPSAAPVVTHPAGPTTCPDRALTLTATASPQPAAAGGRISFVVTVKNTGSASCHRDLGGGALEVVVHSGADRIWSSADCSTDHSASVQTLAGGGSLQTTVSWLGTRSAPGCSGARAVAKPGTYTVQARLGTFQGAVTVFLLS
nr:hypothetical protein Hi04_10k_c2835_00034 [uncultured bacterium]